MSSIDLSALFFNVSRSNISAQVWWLEIWHGADHLGYFQTQWRWVEQTTWSKSSLVSRQRCSIQKDIKADFAFILCLTANTKPAKSCWKVLQHWLHSHSSRPFEWKWLLFWFQSAAAFLSWVWQLESAVQRNNWLKCCPYPSLGKKSSHFFIRRKHYVNTYLGNKIKLISKIWNVQMFRHL